MSDKRTEKRTETHVCDPIDRQAAIDAVKHAWAKGLEPTQFLEDLPSAQPDVPDTNVGDMISRQAAIDALEKVAELYPWRVPGDRDSYSQYNEAWQDALNRADSEIEALPAAQPERKKGEWSDGYRWQRCSLCKQTGKKSWNYCPNCGADMRGEQNGSN